MRKNIAQTRKCHTFAQNVFFFLSAVNTASRVWASVSSKLQNKNVINVGKNSSVSGRYHMSSFTTEKKSQKFNYFVNTLSYIILIHHGTQIYLHGMASACKICKQIVHIFYMLCTIYVHFIFSWLVAWRPD